MKRLIKLKINVSKIDKTKMFYADSGAVYLDAQFYLNEEPDQYGNHGMITQEISKEDKEKGERGAILGNAKMLTFADRDSAPAPKRQAPKKEPVASFLDKDDDSDLLPF